MTIITQSYDFWGEAWDFAVTCDGVTVEEIISIMSPKEAYNVASALDSKYPGATYSYINVDETKSPHFV